LWIATWPVPPEKGHAAAERARAAVGYAAAEVTWSPERIVIVFSWAVFFRRETSILLSGSGSYDNRIFNIVPPGTCAWHFAHEECRQKNDEVSYLIAG
jgi:hypothetical protein